MARGEDNTPLAFQSLWFFSKCFFLISCRQRGPSSALAVYQWAARAEPPTLLSFLENAVSRQERDLPKSPRNPASTGMRRRNRSPFCNNLWTQQWDGVILHFRRTRDSARVRDVEGQGWRRDKIHAELTENSPRGWKAPVGGWQGSEAVPTPRGY